MTVRTCRGVRRLLNAGRKVRAGLRLRGESISPEVPNDLYQAHRSIYLFAGRLVEDRRVLDLGCGSGYGTVLLKEHGARAVVGLDLDPRSIRYARRSFSGEGVEFLVGDAEALPPGLGELDFVVASNVLEHLRSPGFSRLGAVCSWPCLRSSTTGGLPCTRRFRTTVRTC